MKIKKCILYLIVPVSIMHFSIAGASANKMLQYKSPSKVMKKNSIPKKRHAIESYFLLAEGGKKSDKEREQREAQQKKRQEEKRRAYQEKKRQEEERRAYQEKKRQDQERAQKEWIRRQAAIASNQSHSNSSKDPITIQYSNAVDRGENVFIFTTLLPISTASDILTILSGSDDFPVFFAMDPAVFGNPDSMMAKASKIQKKRNDKMESFPLNSP